MQGGGGEGSDREAGVGSPGRTAESAGVTVPDDSVTEAEEAEGNTEGVASSRTSGHSRRWTSAIVLLHTWQKGSGHNI